MLKITLNLKTKFLSTFVLINLTYIKPWVARNHENTMRLAIYSLPTKSRPADPWGLHIQHLKYILHNIYMKNVCFVTQFYVDLNYQRIFPKFPKGLGKIYPDFPPDKS